MNVGDFGELRVWDLPKCFLNSGACSSIYWRGLSAFLLLFGKAGQRGIEASFSAVPLFNNFRENKNSIWIDGVHLFEMCQKILINHIKFSCNFDGCWIAPSMNGCLHYFFQSLPQKMAWTQLLHQFIVKNFQQFLWSNIKNNISRFGQNEIVNIIQFIFEVVLHD